MTDTVTKAIETLAEKAQSKQTQPHEALHLSQAALNLAHTKQVLAQVEQGQKG